MLPLTSLRAMRFRHVEAERIGGSPAAATQPLFGHDEALHMLGGDEDLLADVAAIARTHLPEQLDSLRAALDASDEPTARRHAHTMKGTVATLGAGEVREQAMLVEHAARDGDLPAARAAFGNLENLTRRLVQELGAYLGRA